MKCWRIRLRICEISSHSPPRSRKVAHRDEGTGKVCGSSQCLTITKTVTDCWPIQKNLCVPRRRTTYWILLGCEISEHLHLTVNRFECEGWGEVDIPKTAAGHAFFLTCLMEFGIQSIIYLSLSSPFEHTFHVLLETRTYWLFNVMCCTCIKAWSSYDVESVGSF